MEPLEGAEVEAERTVEHDGRRGQPDLAERLAGGGEAAAGGHEQRDPTPLELGDGREHRRGHLVVVVPERAVEVGDDELDG